MSMFRGISVSYFAAKPWVNEYIPQWNRKTVLITYNYCINCMNSVTYYLLVQGAKGRKFPTLHGFSSCSSFIQVFYYFCIANFSLKDLNYTQVEQVDWNNKNSMNYKNNIANLRLFWFIIWAQHVSFFTIFNCLYTRNNSFAEFNYF